MATKPAVWSFYLFFGLFHAGKDVFNFQRTYFLIDLSHVSSSQNYLNFTYDNWSDDNFVILFCQGELSSWICLDLLWFLKF